MLLAWNQDRGVFGAGDLDAVVIIAGRGRALEDDMLATPQTETH